MGALLLGLAACFPVGLDGQRVCQDPVTCAKLVELTCGADDRCASEDSCLAARRLETRGDDGACHSAWCDLGESYRGCP
jgi:hypothetical protein